MRCLVRASRKTRGSRHGPGVITPARAAREPGTIARQDHRTAARRNVATAGWVLFLATDLLSGCRWRVGEGKFTCQPDDPTSCPAGFFCQQRAGTDEFRCYSTGTPGFCGDGVVDYGEACDGEYLGKETCRDRGYFAGKLTCGQDCRIQESDCVRIVSVTTSYDTVCGLDSTGRAWCWGNNYNGQVGDNSAVDRPSPVAVALPYRVDAVSAGVEHACALEQNGQAWCWGNNYSGELGVGTREDWRLVPARVSGDATFVSIAAGSFRTCGLEHSGQAWCWGDNHFGQLGDGTREDRTKPVKVEGQNDFAQISTGKTHSCGLDRSGQAWCWGDNSYGQLGDNSTHQECTNDPLEAFDCSLVPVQVAAEHDLVQISAGRAHSCALDGAGQAWCWGSNAYGQLGDGVTHQDCDGFDCSPVPVRVAGGRSFTAISCGQARTSALDTDGRVWSWGQSPLGDGTTESSSTPVMCETEELFDSVAAGHDITCATTRSGGKVLCWGFNGTGQLGIETQTNLPNPVATEISFSTVASGSEHTCGIDVTGRAWCWGSDNGGKLGDRSTLDKNRPVAVVGDTTFTALAPGSLHTCGLDLQGSVWCWGVIMETTDYEWLFFSLEPSEVMPGQMFVDLTSGWWHVCALDTGGQAWCWGDNMYGQLGVDVLPGTSDASPVAGGHSFVTISTGSVHTCAIDEEGYAWCWGSNGVSQLGDGTDINRNQPVRVLGGKHFSRIACGLSHTCGIDQDGLAWCWGFNWSGEAGTASAEAVLASPAAVYGDLSFTAISAGDYEPPSPGVPGGYTCGLDVDGGAWCWGFNEHGELGDGTYRSISVPVPVSGGHVFRDVSAGDGHVCAVDTENAVWCWGSNKYGQLGIDAFATFPTEVSVPAAY